MKHKESFVQEDNQTSSLTGFRPKIGELDGIAEKVTL